MAPPRHENLQRGFAAASGSTVSDTGSAISGTVAPRPDPTSAPAPPFTKELFEQFMQTYIRIDTVRNPMPAQPPMEHITTSLNFSLAKNRHCDSSTLFYR